MHLYGQMCDMDAILDLAEKYNLIVIEDACQAHGAEYFSRKQNRWFKAGSMGHAAAFSFYPGKNLGACGEGGAVTTNDPEIAQRVRMLRDHGQAKKYYHDMEGYNGRLDAIQAGFLRVKLRHLAEWNSKRREAGTLCRAAFRTWSYNPLRTRLVPGHLSSLCIRSPDREKLQKQAQRSGREHGAALSGSVAYAERLCFQKR